MPIHDYRCEACSQTFELLVRSSTVPACPHCGATTLERLLSLTAPAGTSQAIIASGRRAAAREGHFSHYSRGEKSKLSK
jgi:putative FmdB family regulatory protein